MKMQRTDLGKRPQKRTIFYFSLLIIFGLTNANEFLSKNEDLKTNQEQDKGFIQPEKRTLSKRNVQDDNYIIINDFSYSKSEYYNFPNELKQMLKQSNYINKPTLSGRILQRSVSFSVEAAAPQTYYEDSGPMTLFQTPLTITTSDGISRVEILLINIVDSGHEVLTLDTFTLSSTADVGGRNVSFDYDVTPEYHYNTSTSSRGIIELTNLANDAEYAAALATLKYENTKEEPLATLRGVKVTVWGSGGSEVDQNVFFNFANVNDAPIFREQPGVVVGEEDTFSTFFTVRSYSIGLVGDSIQDNDIGSELALAVLGCDNSNGVWSYQDSDNSFKTIPSGTRDSNNEITRDVTLLETSLLLSEKGLTFTPNPDFNGETSITVVAWDKTGDTSDFTHGSFANATYTGHQGAYSADLATITIRINAVNDAPAATASTIHLATFVEDDSINNEVPVNKLVEACSDVDQQHNGSLLSLGVAVTACDNSNGRWDFTVDGTSWQPVSTFAVLLGENSASNSNSKLRFVASPDFFGGAEVTFKCWDFTAGSNGDTGVDASFSAHGPFSSTEVVGTVTVANSNDPPSLTPAHVEFPLFLDSQSSLEAGVEVTQLLSGHFSDIDNDPPGLAVVGMQSATVGHFEYSCSDSWLMFGGLSPESATLLGPHCYLRYTPSVTTSVDYGHIDIIAWDQSNHLTPGGANVNTTLDSDSYGAQTVTILVVAQELSFQPVITGAQTALTFTENDDAIPLFSDVTITNMTSQTGGSLTVTLLGQSDAGAERLVFGNAFGFADETEVATLGLGYRGNETVVVVTGPATELDYSAVLRSFSYAHSSDDPSTGGRSVSAVVVDTAGTSSKSFARDLVVVPVNDRPRVAVQSQSGSWNVSEFYNESALIFGDRSDFIFSDVDDSSPSSLVVSLLDAVDGNDESLQVPLSFERRIDVNETLYFVKTVETSSTYTDHSLTIALLGDATSDDYTEVIRHLTYSNTGTTRGYSQRRVAVCSVDSSGATSNEVTSVLNVLRDNDTTTIIPDPPTIVRLTALPFNTTQTPAIHTDAKFSSGDKIQIQFNVNTNTPPLNNLRLGSTVLSRDVVDSIFEVDLVDPSIVGAYHGVWIQPDLFEITVLREGYPQKSILVGGWTVAPKPNPACLQTADVTDASQQYCIRDVTAVSAASFEVSPTLEGNWGLNIPDISSVVVQHSTKNDQQNFVASGTTDTFGITPALSKHQLDQLCALGYDAIFGDLSQQFAGLVAALLSCDNHYVRQFDHALDTQDRVPTMSRVIVVFEAPTQQFLIADVTDSLLQSFDRDVIVSVVTGDTGVHREALLDYDPKSSVGNVTVLIENESDLTPQISSYSLSRGDSSIPSDDLTIQRLDKITITFDRNTDRPNIANQSEIDKIFEFEPVLSGLSGVWLNAMTLELTLTEEVTFEGQSIKVGFKVAMLDGQVQVPAGFAENQNCVGVDVCGANEFSVGICEENAQSCRVNGSISLSHAASVVSQSVSSGVEWYWLLLLAVFLLAGFGTFLMLARRKRRREKEEGEQYDDYKSIGRESSVEKSKNDDVSVMEIDSDIPMTPSTAERFTSPRRPTPKQEVFSITPTLVDFRLPHTPSPESIRKVHFHGTPIFAPKPQNHSASSLRNPEKPNKNSPLPLSRKISPLPQAPSTPLNPPLLKRSNSARAKWRRALSLVTASKNSTGDDLGVFTTRSKQDPVYVPSFPETHHRRHRSSVSGLPLSWYVDTATKPVSATLRRSKSSRTESLGDILWE